MQTRHKSIHKSLLAGVCAFIALLCVLLSVLAYFMVSQSLYSRYDAHLENVITYVENNISQNGLRQCIRSKQTSAHYYAAQSLLNGLIDDFGLAYLYICIPVDDGNGTMISVVSATSAEERAAGEEDWPLLYIEPDAYTPEQLRPYLEAWNEAGITYFETDSDRWGTTYVGCKPLVAPDGETYALLCADISIADLHAQVNRYVFLNAALIVLMGFIFGMISFAWLRRDVTGPVLALEKSAKSFAEQSHGKKDPKLLIFDAPEIHTRNEVESLANAISQMSEDMKTYVEDILSAEERASSAESIAYQDALTHTKSKAAYDEKVTALEESIRSGDVSFALVMVDLNQLKKINDSYGHEHGNQYIIGSCHLICEIFDHSPVYRVGGDEFIVVLQGNDYVNRETLFANLEAAFDAAEHDALCAPWEQYSAAMGMAVYHADRGDTVETVFRRADERMYQRKKEMKAQR